MKQQRELLKNLVLDIENDLENFRTLHSFAFRKLGITKEKMMGPDDYREFGIKMWHSY